MTIRIRVKYCGGCNPTYDRVQLGENLKKKLSGMAELVSADNRVDLVLAIQGCETACADLSAFPGMRLFSIVDAGHTAIFIKWLKQNYCQEKNASMEKIHDGEKN